MCKLTKVVEPGIGLEEGSLITFQDTSLGKQF